MDLPWLVLLSSTVGIGVATILWFRKRQLGQARKRLLGLGVPGCRRTLQD